MKTEVTIEDVKKITDEHHIEFDDADYNHYPINILFKIIEKQNESIKELTSMVIDIQEHLND